MNTQLQTVIQCWNLAYHSVHTELLHCKGREVRQVQYDATAVSPGTEILQVTLMKRHLSD